MNLLLIVALALCAVAVWPLRGEVAGLFPYLCVQGVATTAALWTWFAYGLDSEHYRQVHYAGQGAAIFAAVVLVGTMLGRYALNVGVVTFGVAVLVGAYLPVLLAMHLKGPYRGELPVSVTVILWMAGACLFCGLASLLSLVPPTLAPMPTWTRVILGGMWVALGAYKLAYLAGSATKNTASWQTVNQYLPVTLETAAFGALAVLATLQGEAARQATEIAK